MKRARVRSFTDVQHSIKTGSGKIVIVAVNKLNAIVHQKITINDATVNEMTPYSTTEFTNVVAGNKVTVSSNNFTYSLPPLSVTTFVQL